MTYEERYNNFDLNDFLANDPEMQEFLEKEYEKEKENYKELQDFYKSINEECSKQNDESIAEALNNPNGADDVVEFLASRFPDVTNE